MITNKQVKDFLGQSGGGLYAVLKKSVFYPTVKRRGSTVLAKTADYTVTLADLKTETIISNTGASGTIVITLPSVASAKGYVLLLNVLATQIVRALPQTGEAVNYNGSAVVTKYLNIAAVIGNYATLYCDGTQWIVTDANGVVTKEA
jgi:hypothetical protein